jgi:mannose-6-phosphate isomerase-like protein (cupin superfamily)
MPRIPGARRLKGDEMGTDRKSFARSFDRPDERREFKGHGHLDVLGSDDGNVIGRGVFEPGWKWSNDVQPIAGTRSCEAEHLGYCVSGSMVVRMDDGEEIRIKKGDSFYLRPGHDAWVEGSERCELVDFGGFKDYAKPALQKKSA